MRRRVWIAVVIVLAGLLGGLLLIRQGGESKFSAAEFQQLLDDKNAALGLLENFETVDAVAALNSIAQRLPNEPFAVRNQAVAQLLALDTEREDPAAAWTAAREAVNQMLELEEDSADALWLAAYLMAHNAMGPPSVEQQRQALELLDRAASLAPNDVRIAYAMYSIGRDSRDAEIRARGEAALEQAYQAAPENIHLLTLWIELQAQRESPQVVDTLRRARQTLAPLETQIVRETRHSAADLIDQAVTLAETAQWPKLRQQSRALRNLVLFPEVTKRDLAAIDPHPLDYVAMDYSDEFYQRATATAPATEPPIVVTLQAFDHPQQPAAAACLAVELADFDLDGQLDIIALEQQSVVVYHRQQGRWQELVRAATPSAMTGMLLGDLDREQGRRALSTPGHDELVAAAEAAPTAACHNSDLDLVVFGSAGVRVFRNRLNDEGGRRVLELIEQQDLDAAEFSVSAAALVDVDHDADLDLALATDQGIRLWSCLGESMQFEDITPWSVLPPADVQFSSIVAADWDRDVDIDLLLADPAGRVTGWLENLRHTRFAWRPLGEAWSCLRQARQVAVVEADGNASWDLLTAGGFGVRLARTAGGPAGVEQLAGVDQAAVADVQGMLTLDYDNDGRLDVVFWTRQSGELLLLRCSAAGGFAIDPGALPKSLKNIVACAAGDLDQDGDLDLAAAGPTGVTLLRNDGGNQNHWLDVRAMGRMDNRGRANHTGIGAMMELQAGDLYQAQVVTGQQTHFGLGRRQQAAALRIVWTNGVPQTVVRPAADLVLCEPMVLKGSCPYIYTWTGEQYEFFTDCLWAAPLGLQVADGVLAPSRSWEYLRIPGERLVEHQGMYRLKITEELWEAGYFDSLQLLAVDHPADVEIYSNEKVGPAEIAEFKVHTVRQPQAPVAARDSTGRDVLPLVAARDGRFLQAFQRRLRHGLTEPHYLELDLGDLSSPQEITLFLTGWIFPADTSLNLAFDQDPQLDGPQLPAVWTPDAKGDWRQVNAYMGFPGGKTKTIAVDLSSAFETDDYRLRIATSAEIYWDQAFFTVDPQPAEVRVKRLTPAAAELQYRGFSARRGNAHHGPEHYEHGRITTGPIWPPMAGEFTRYGDVLPLLQAGDDQLVVLGAGDALTVQFPVPPPPPPGWKRDFLLHSVGWDKDADLNTFYGQSAAPLPFAAMSSYPQPPLEGPPQTRAYRQYLQTYQTRRHGRQFWRQILDYPQP